MGEQAPRTPDDNRPRRLSVHLAAGVTIPSGNEGGGNVQSVSIGYSPTPRLTVLVSGGRTHMPTHVRHFSDGRSVTRGGTLQIVSGEVRFARRSGERATPYAVTGAGLGVWGPNVNDIFTRPVTNERIRCVFSGRGLVVPLGPHLRVSGDAGFLLVVGERNVIGLILPLRVGLAWRF